MADVGVPSLLQAPSSPARQVFVAYSYKLYPSDDYRPVFRDLESRYEVKFIFADEKITNMHILEKIKTFIRGSDFAIFDISGWNPNVTLELGFAMAHSEKWYIAIDPAKTPASEVPSDLRGIDRIQYSSYSELRQRLTLLMEQHYPQRKVATLDDFIQEKRGAVRQILKSSPGTTIGSMSQIMSLDVPVVQLVVHPMVGDELEVRGMKRGARYYLKGTAPTEDKT